MERNVFIQTLLPQRTKIKDWCHYLSQDYQLGQEIYSETITIALEQCEKCHEGKVNKWVASIAKHLVWHHRSAKPIIFTEISEKIPLKNRITYQDNTFETDHIYAAINRLTAKEKKIIQLHMDGYRHGEISAILKLKPGYVKSRICTVRKEILKRLN